jgi:hypothetical protein
MCVVVVNSALTQFTLFLTFEEECTLVPTKVGMATQRGLKMYIASSMPRSLM